MKAHFFHVIWDAELIFGPYNLLGGQYIGQNVQKFEKIEKIFENFSFFLRISVHLAVFWPIYWPPNKLLWQKINSESQITLKKCPLIKYNS